MHQTMFPLLIVNILENHATKEHPLTITEITQFVNREFAPFAMEKEQLMNRSTVMPDPGYDGVLDGGRTALEFSGGTVWFRE